MESLLQLTVFAMLGIVFNNVLTNFRDFLALVAAWLILFTTTGRGWPYSPPCGNFTNNTLKAGAAMTILTLAAAATTYWVSHAATIFNPSFFAVIFLWILIVWGIVMSGWPLYHAEPKKGLIIAVVTSIIISVSATIPLQNILNIDNLHVLTVSNLGLTLIFSTPFVLQGCPFTSLWRQPKIGLAIIATTSIPTLLIMYLTSSQQFFSETALRFFSSVILWSVVLSWSMAYPLTLRFRQPKRGIATIVAVLFVSGVWSTNLSGVVSADGMMVLNLLWLLPTIIMHNIYWLRKPLSPPLLIGMPPQGHTDLNKLGEWVEQV